MKDEIFSHFSNIDVLGSGFKERFDNLGNIINPSPERGPRPTKDNLKKSTLVTQYGLKMQGYSFGADVSRAGEVVF